MVLDRVGRDIVAGLYEPGTPLDPAALERDLDVSRPVVREVLRVLDTLGMVRAWPKRGTFVRPRSDWNWLHPLVLSWSQDQHRDVEFLQAVAQMREIVEPNVAAIAASHRTEAEALELGAALSAMERADWDIERFIDADVRFHHVLLWATHNELLAQMASVIESAIRNHDRGVSAQHWVESLVLHREVADAVARRSPGAAEAAMRKVLAQALSDIVGADGPAAHVTVNGREPGQAGALFTHRGARCRQSGARLRVLTAGGGGALMVDEATGLPTAIEFPPSTHLAPVVCTTSLVVKVGGEEVRALAGGLDYPGAEQLSGFSLVEVETTAPGPSAGASTDATEEGGNSQAWRARTELLGWSLLLDYLVGAQLPRVRLAFELTRPAAEVRPVRNVELELAFALEPAEWLLHSPGNRVAPGTCLGELGAELVVSPVTGSLGSLGLVALSHRHVPACLVLWPFSHSEIGWITLVPETGGVRLRLRTNLAGDPAPGESLRYSGINFDVLAEGWDKVRGRVRPALPSLGVRTPGPKPDWARSAAIYEVQVGRSVFLDGWSYEPFARLEDVTADLGRIVALGFDTIQLMPHQPYPSYNVHDYDDIDTTYGGEEALALLVQRAHEFGLRVVLDVVLHGVLDRRSIRDALERVEQSGILDAPAALVGDVFAGTPSASAALQRAWCQHIVDFGPYWFEGSPEVHPLTTEHSEWFCRDSSGRFTGIYTEAFDLAEESWQSWFCETALRLVERFGIDGFRFDAPTYNNFANWSSQRRRRASDSSTGCVALFERLRSELKTRFPDVLMFTEPSGVVLRQSMDMNYNYDELWLVPALTAGHGETPTVISGRQLASWFDERDATLPADALTCHHLDSHDTFWWPAPGRKWRREQIGLPATRALTWCLALSGGAFMMFTGGEAGMEEELARTLALRRQRDELRDGAADFSAAVFDHEAVFAVLRYRGGSGVLVTVNLSARQINPACELRGGWRFAGTETEGPRHVDLGPYGLALLEVRR